VRALGGDLVLEGTRGEQPLVAPEQRRAEDPVERTRAEGEVVAVDCARVSFLVCEPVLLAAGTSSSGSSLRSSGSPVGYFQPPITENLRIELAVVWLKAL
jgi:hypothetical protein